MGGASGTPLAQKLGVRPGSRVVVLGEAVQLSLEPLPEGASGLRGARQPVDNKHCAVDDVGSGLRFVYRLADRPAR